MRNRSRRYFTVATELNEATGIGSYAVSRFIGGKNHNDLRMCVEGMYTEGRRDVLSWEKHQLFKPQLSCSHRN